MSDRVTVDAVIVSYNTRELLAACLASLELHSPAEPGPELRVKVLDNASTDGSAEMVATSFPAIELVCSEHNLGFARATNRLVSTSDADYVLLLNPDTVLTEDVVTPLWRVLESDPRIILAGPRLVYPDGTQQFSGEQLPSLRYELACILQGTKADWLLRPFIDLSSTIAATRQHDLVGSTDVRPVEFLWATCWLLKTVDALGFGPFDERFTTYDEDLDLCRRLSDAGRLVVYVPTVSLVHVGGASSDPARKQRLTRVARERYYRRHGGFMSAVAYRAILGFSNASKWVLGHLRSS